MERKLSAILAADVVGYSRLMGGDEEGTLQRLKSLHKDLVQPEISRRNGRVVKLMGDGLLADFPSVVEAVLCALEIQRSLAGREQDRPEAERIQLRIGVNLGDVIVEAGDIYGDGVNIAARLEGLAEPNGICVSASVVEAIDGKIAALVEDLGPQTVKNIAKPVRAYRLRLGTDEGHGAPPQSGPRLPDKPSIAVLPFENLSGRPEFDPFTDGITEEIVTTLSKVSKLFVVARNSTLVYKGRAVDIRQVGREQGVQFVLEGSVRAAGDRLRITAQLIEASSGRHLWAQRFDRVSGDVFLLQDDLTKEIVSALQVELTEGEQARLAAGGTQNAEAWRLAFEGQTLVHEHHKDSVQKGRRLLERAVDLDEDYALAWGALAEAHWKNARHNGWSDSPERSLALAVEASDRALVIEPENAGFAAMRSIITVTLGDHDEARALAERALRNAHSEANAIALAGLALGACGEVETAIRQTRLAMRYCPRYPPWYLVSLAYSYWMLERSGEAIAACQAAIEADPDVDLPHIVLAMVYAELGRDAEARKEAQAVLRVDPHFSAIAYMRGLPYRDPDMQERRRSALKNAGLPD